MTFARYALESVAWTTPPDVFASSNMAERGFCKTCGTPLTFHWAGRPFVGITLNSFDHPDAMRPAVSFETGQKAGWLEHLDSVPGEISGSAGVAGFISHQVP